MCDARLRSRLPSLRPWLVRVQGYAQATTPQLDQGHAGHRHRHRHRAAARGEPDRRADRGRRVQRRGARATPDRPGHRPAAERAERLVHEDELYRLEFPDPRHRRVVGRGQRRLRRRDALQLDADQEPAAVRDRVLRRAARRSAARAAGHAVRAQRDRRCRQHHRAQAGEGFRRQRRARGGQLQRAQGEGHGEHPARRHRLCALRRHQLQARRLHRQPRDRQRHRRPRSVVGTRRAALHAERRSGPHADGQPLQGRLEPRARHEADVPPRSGRLARLPAGYARLRGRQHARHARRHSRRVGPAAARSRRRHSRRHVRRLPAAAGAHQHRHRRQHRLARAERSAQDLCRVRPDLQGRRDRRHAGVLV